MSDVSDWWRTKIIQMEPGKIEFRGRSIEELIDSVVNLTYLLSSHA